MQVKIVIFIQIGDIHIGILNFSFYYPFPCTPTGKFNLDKGRTQIPDKFKLVALWYKYDKNMNPPIRLL